RPAAALAGVGSSVKVVAGGIERVDDAIGDDARTQPGELDIAVGEGAARLGQMPIGAEPVIRGLFRAVLRARPTQPGAVLLLRPGTLVLRVARLDTSGVLGRIVRRTATGGERERQEQQPRWLHPLMVARLRPQRKPTSCPEGVCSLDFRDAEEL